MRSIHLLSLPAMATALVAGAPASAQCTVIDFENYSVGTVITDQYDGVEFFGFPGSCGGFGTVNPVIVEPPDGTSSPTRALGIQTGCPDFSPDIFLIQFEELQRMVRFTLGEGVTPGTRIQVVAYDGDYDVIYNDTMTCGSGVYHLVEIGVADGDPVIQRVAVAALDDFFETLDDFNFDFDPTPPTVRIDYPRHSDCLCSGPITLTGIVCDEDGEHDFDQLEYRRAGTSDPWTLVRRFDGQPVCEPNDLYTWQTDSLDHGRYYLRVTAQNECGGVSTDTVYALLDKEFGEATITRPDGETVCGLVEIEGSVSDHCRMCFVEYTVEYRQVPNGVYKVVDPARPTYDEVVINGTLATWDLRDGSIPDGRYTLRVIGRDECGNTKTAYASVTVNQSEGCGCLGDLDENGTVDFGDIILILSSWGPCE